MKKYLILCFGVLLLSLSGCVGLTDKGYMYDDPDLIAQEGDSYTYHSKVGTYEDLVFEDFSGTETVYSFSDIEIVNIHIDYSISKGKFKVVLIDENFEIIELKVGDHEITLDHKPMRLKIVGAHAYGSVSINYE